MFIVFAGVILCAILFATLVYRYDMYDKEPWYMLLLAVGLGYFVMQLVGTAEDYTYRNWTGESEDLVRSAVIAATHEEAARCLLVLAFALLAKRHFNNPMDGLIYGSFFGVGMAIYESQFYLSLRSDSGITAIGTEAVRVMLHLLMAGLSGFGVGMIVIRKPYWVLWTIVWLSASMTIHFLWDYLIGLPQLRGEDSLSGRINAVVLMLIAMLFFGGTVMLASRFSQEHFAERETRPLWGWPFRKS